MLFMLYIYILSNLLFYILRLFLYIDDKDNFY